MYSVGWEMREDSQVMATALVCLVRRFRCFLRGLMEGSIFSWEVYRDDAIYLEVCNASVAAKEAIALVPLSFKRVGP